MDIKKKLSSFALNSLAKRMLTKKEVSEKLQRLSKKLEENAEILKEHQVIIQDIINELEEKKLLNDEFYVQTYLNYELETNFRGKWGYWEKLMKKGIEKELFEKTWQELNPNEEKLAKKLLENNSFRFSQEKDEYKRKAKIQRFLQGRGFSFEAMNTISI